MRSLSNFASSNKAWGYIFPQPRTFKATRRQAQQANLAREARPSPSPSPIASRGMAAMNGRASGRGGEAGQTETTQGLPVLPHQWGWGPAGAPAAGR